MDIALVWLVFLVFLSLALFTERVWVTAATISRFPFTIGEKERKRMVSSDVPAIRPLGRLAAVGSGLLALAITSQRLWGLLS
jgi:hypothetical protein